MSSQQLKRKIEDVEVPFSAKRVRSKQTKSTSEESDEVKELRERIVQQDKAMEELHDEMADLKIELERRVDPEHYRIPMDDDYPDCHDTWALRQEIQSLNGEVEQLYENIHEAIMANKPLREEVGYLTRDLRECDRQRLGWKRKFERMEQKFKAWFGKRKG